MSLEYSHGMVLGAREYVEVPESKLDYNILHDGTAVKASWVRNATVKECADWFVKEMRGRFVDELGYFLARTSIGNPVSRCEINEVVRGAIHREEKMRKRLEKARRRRRMEKQRHFKKENRTVTVSFEN